MFERFTDWYRRSHLVVEKAALEDRWKALATIASSVSTMEALELLRVVIGIETQGRDFQSRIVSLVHDAGDITLGSQNNAEEIRATAAGIVSAILLYRTDPLQSIVALALLSARFLELKDEFSSVLCNLACTQLELNAQAQRQRSATATTVPLPSVGEGQTEGQAGEVAPVVLQSDFIAVIESMTATLERLSANDQQRAEETDLLWWVLTGYSRIAGRSLRSFAFPDIIVLAALEEADRTHTTIGPLRQWSILDAVLRRAGADIEQVTSLKKVAQKVSEEVASFCDDRRNSAVADLAPVMEALHRSREARGGDGWATTFKSACHCDPATEMSGFEISKALLTELLFTKAYSLGI